MQTIYVHSYSSPCGTILLGSIDNRLCLCDWKNRKNRKEIDNRLIRFLQTKMVQGTSPIIEQAEKELNEYFAGTRHSFSVVPFFVGTEFQKTVWTELLHIPYGTTISYADLAKRISMPTAVRAVANANRANAISIIVPCHRVIGTNGKLTGYAGGLAAKQWLLEKEHAELLYNSNI